MKKNILFFASVLFVGATATAQTTEFDAIRMAQTDIVGTARYMGMAGAFGALGGDVSSVKDNPAGLGIYRSSEITTTFNFSTQSTKSKWEGIGADDDLSKLGFNNFSYVTSFPTWNGQSGNNKGLLQSNWIFSYNRQKNFNRNARIKSGLIDDSLADYISDFTIGAGITADAYADDKPYLEDLFYDDKLPWITTLAVESGLIDTVSWLPEFASRPTQVNYRSIERGCIDEYSLAWGGNFSNKFYLGVGLNVSSINYEQTRTFIEDYTTSPEPTLTTGSTLLTTGIGINMNIGLIFRPINELRLGLSYKTPTVYIMTDELSNVYMDMVKSPIYATTDYELRIPGKLNVSAAYVLGRKAILSTELVSTNYRKTRIYENRGSNYFDDNNHSLKSNAKRGYLLKAGGEYRLTDQISLRAGYAFETAIQNENMGKLLQYNTTRVDPEFFIHKGASYLTAGLGYRGNNWYLDGAFVNKNMKQDFMPYRKDPDAVFKAAKVTTRNYDVIATIGLRF